MGYQLVIGYNPQQEETGATDASRYLTLDLQTSKRAQASSTICSMPIQSGEVISDHMYRNPTTVTVSGSFGILAGNRFSQDARKKYGDTIEWYDYNERGGIDRLTNVEEIFEDIKNRGFLCTLMTMSDNNEESFRFRQRKNMVLRDISWEEMENTVKYEFTFFEAIIVNASNTYNMPEAERSKLGLPNVKTLDGVSLSEVMSQSGDIALAVLVSLLDNGIITEDFLKAIAFNRNGVYTYGTLAALCGIIYGGTMAAIGVSTAISLAAGGSALGWLIGSSGLATGGATLVIAAGLALIAGVALGINAIIREQKAKEQFGNAWNALQKIKGSNNNDEKASILNKILESVQLQFLGFKSNVIIYSFPDNNSCEALIKVGGSIYTISASRKSSYTYDSDYDCPWRFKVELASQKEIKYQRDVSFTRTIIGYYGDCNSIISPPPTNFGDLDFLTNGWFCSNDGQYQVFLTNIGLGIEKDYPSGSPSGWKRRTDLENTYYSRVVDAPFTDKQKEILADLRNYQIVVCKGNMKTEYNRITNGIFDALKAYEE